MNIQNPFIFTISPELFVGYSKETEKIIKSIKNKEKATLLIGPTGSGKTTMLRYIAESMKDEYKILYIPKPPKNPFDFINIFRPFIRGIFDFFKRNTGITLYNLGYELNKKLKNNHLLFFIDECHEASVESLEWLRTFIDQVDRLSIVMAGLPILNKMLKEHLETFLRRINTKVELISLTRYEVRELIKKRIESVNGEDIKPFTDNVINYIYQKTGGFPREVIRMCYELFEKTKERGVTTIDIEMINESRISGPDIHIPQTPEADFTKTLPEKQRIIVEIIGSKELTPTEIVSKLKPEEYKNKSIAIRSVNNILRRLMAEGIVERTKYGKAYRYKLTEKYKTFMVEA